MTDILIAIVLALAIIQIIFLWIWMKKSSDNNPSEKITMIENKLENLANDILRLERLNRDDSIQDREEFNRQFKENRQELAMVLRNFQDILQNSLLELNKMQSDKFDSLSTRQQDLLEKVREAIEKRLESIQNNNEKKLEEMRMTVDEKLQASVEKRFNESFKLISERLDMVQQGLGEMQTLATGVGDLKRVLTNVKTRGTLGEIQLGTILEQVLSPTQYEKNAQCNPDSMERVEYAIVMPGRNADDKPVLLPIDSKFPMEDYQRLVEAYDTNTNLEQVLKSFENSVKKNAKDIHTKYLNPPTTTDFGIMFVPTEGLYAEILRRPGLFEYLQRENKITVVGPSNLVAFLSSLQMGFRTLAIEKRSSEVWELLSAVKTEFGNFGTVLDKTKKKLQEATNVIDQASTRSRAIERRLRDVQVLPSSSIIEIEAELKEDDEDDQT
ncbi:MAG: DNA recombination protein RmuC [Erysipelothrix sp.]|nr:DNA recombination protein RmuC [Erysipelothrix sp.]